MAGKAMVVVLGLLVGSGHVAFAQEAPTGQPVTDPKDLRELDKFEEMMSLPGVATQHRDIYYRELAMEAYKSGAKERALKMFMRAASYADKPSQAALANMYWDGIGTPVDRPPGLCLDGSSRLPRLCPLHRETRVLLEPAD